MSALTYGQAVAIGILQGVTELFPISSLGHSVLVPAWLGGSWNALVTEGGSGKGAPYLAFVVALHVATALALLVFYWRDYLAVVQALAVSARTRTVETAEQRLAWLLVIACVPVGVLGLAFEHPLRVLFAKPLAAGVFLTINGLVLAGGEVLRRRAAAPSRQIDQVGAAGAAGVGFAQSFALLAGISRSGVTMVGGLLRGLSHEDAAKFAFLLATPVILAAGVLKLPELAGPQGRPILAQALAGSVAAALAAYLSVRFLTRYFHTHTLVPFAVYCLVAGGCSVARFV
ncbi:Bacitracin resistance protein BacA [Segniliparus rotundus DSM 44985]|uniref:Undecaprenyl-diphosphatase n=1 Tax=Segniliparus rotundus (strain ATCC BAA-972 / CDC 1076 / CIP 108378 / DSM 44985 / JCM 13578) TaxID=640132 RepID=D6ZDM4_SEGRD|nr:undecaprenyl-diphosphate phosphatase [Segniliparus rotundus]ADG99281.1 Bacitracin resistance protein BacA [Segniliparus rotundus DSM 44985]